MTAEPLDLAALRALAEKATPGPWRMRRHDQRGTFANDNGTLIYVDHLTPEASADAALIVAAVDALPALISEVESLRAVRDAAAAVFRHIDSKGLDGSRYADVLDDLDAALAAQPAPVVAPDRESDHRAGPLIRWAAAHLRGEGATGENVELLRRLDAWIERDAAAPSASGDPRDQDRTAIYEAFRQIVQAEYGQKAADEAMGVLGAAFAAVPYPSAPSSSDSLDVGRQEARIAELTEALADMVNQFAYWSEGENPGQITGGLSALEGAFAALGYDEPHKADHLRCDEPGCSKESTMGWPTRPGGTGLNGGYRRTCWDHSAIGKQRAEAEIAARLRATGTTEPEG